MSSPSDSTEPDACRSLGKDVSRHLKPGACGSNVYGMILRPDVSPASLTAPAPLVDPFGRAISYIRVSVTDRCDFRCVYCMSEDMHFLPKRDLLTLEELDRLCSAFVARGTRTTNGSQLARFATELAACGVKRINVSMDTLDATKFRTITRWGDLDRVMQGLDAAQAAGLAIKINAVA